MESISDKRKIGSLALSLAATTAVVVFPCALALGLRLTEVVTSPVLLIIFPVLLSVATSQGLATWWRRRESSSRVLFEELMIWGWIRNRRFERLLARADEFVGPNANSGLSPEQRAKKLERLSAALDARDPYTHGHSRRVARHAETIAKRLKLPTEETARIRTAALLHDIGKIETPREILEKPGALTDEEYEVIKRHSGAGARMIAQLDDPELTLIIRCHHERIGGGGYPDGITGDEIPFGARIIAVADTFDALTSTRSYRSAKSHDFAMSVLREESGEQLDAAVVDAFDARFAGHRPVALSAAGLGVGRQLGQSLIGLGSGASQVVAVGAAATVIGVAPAVRSAPDPVSKNQTETSRSASVSGSTTAESVPGESTASRTPEPGSTGKKSRGGRDKANRNRSGQKPGDAPGGSGGSGGGGGSAGGTTDPGAGGGSGGGESAGGGGSSGGGSGGGGSGGTGGGGGSSGGGTPASPLAPVTDTVDNKVVESVPKVPKEVPGSGAVNDAVTGVKDISGKLLKPR